MIRAGLPLALGAFFLATAAAMGADDISSFPGVDQLPEGYVVDTSAGFVAALGVPYVLGDDPAEIASNPIYWTHKGKIIGIDVIIGEEQAKKGVNPTQVHQLAGSPPVEHVELEYFFSHPACHCAAWSVRVEFVSYYYLERMFE